MSKLWQKKSSDVSRLFNDWANRDRDKGMEEGHRYAVLQALGGISPPSPSVFLDIGCGNGWLVRHLASHLNYDFGVGIDIASQMVEKAKRLTRSDRLRFYATDIFEWESDIRFNFIVSMEAFYYINPMERLFEKVAKLMAPGGVLLVGTDYYTENPGSAGWAEDLGIALDRRSIGEWKNLFSAAGFDDIRQEQVRYPKTQDVHAWKKKYGSLFTSGTFLGRRD